MTKLFIEDLKVAGKKVLMRVDFNVPLDEDHDVADTSRIVEALVSIKYVLDQGGTLVLMSHLGRPTCPFDKDFSLAPCAKALSGLLERPVLMAPDCVGSEVEQMVSKLKVGEVLLLENLRYYRAEEHPEEDPEFAKQLASFGDLYVFDAFGTAHRKHSSTYTIAKYFPGKAALGYLVQKEIHFLGEALKEPKRPFCTLIGGAKISTKIGVLKSLARKVDALLIGGAMSFTFLKALGKEVGHSLVEEQLIPVAREIIDICTQRKVAFLLPADFICAKVISDDAETKICEIEKGIDDGYQGLDIGPKTIELFSRTLQSAQTILWNGPVGVFELELFAKGTQAIAETLSQSTAVTIVGGGDSIAALNALDLADKMTHVSTGGGATLAFLEYGTLPAIEVLTDRQEAAVDSLRS